MRPERRTQAELDAGVPGLEFVPGGCEVAAEVYACGEEVGDHHHARGSLGDATVAAGRDIGLGQFEEGRDHNRVFARHRQSAGQGAQVVIGRRLAAAVGDE
jgi:hypothetical protein